MRAETSLNRGGARLARGTAVGALTVGLSTAAHVAAGGSAASPAATCILIGIASALGWALSGQTWTTRTLLAAFLLAQTGLHLITSVEAASAPMSSTIVMVTTHALAAAVLVLTVRHGEAALMALIDHLGLRAARLRRSALTLPVARGAMRRESDRLRGLAPARLHLVRAPPRRVTLTTA